MSRVNRAFLAIALCVLLAGVGTAFAGVSPQEAEQLKTTLTPLGGERAGNKDGTIPPWTGGYTKPIPGFREGGRRPDPFANEKPLFSITSKNMAQYADKLTDGVKEMFKKYPDTYRIDVYPTHRTAAAPQYVYDNTFKNATRGKIVDSSSGPIPADVFGGIPFPIPKSGLEAIWNHNLRVRPESWHWNMHAVLITSDGKLITTVVASAEQQMPYFFKEGSPEKWNGEYWMIRLIDSGPPIRAGEAITSRVNVNDDKSQTWVYLTGQRRVRKLPNACCDTPTPATAGIMGFDDLEVFLGRTGRFDWKILGKKEMYIPYNTNRSWVPTKDSDLLLAHFLNPDWVRWELHRVWVVEATLRKGQRHQAPRSVYYLDEDTWMGVLGDRWDASGRLWKTMFMLPMVAPDMPGIIEQTFGFYDLISNKWYCNGVLNEQSEQYRITPRWKDSVFTPDAMAGEGVR